MPDPQSPQKIEEPIRNYIAQNLLFSESGFTYPDDASFLQEGIVDSLGVMQLVEFAAKEFQITIEQREVTADNFDSVTKLAQFVRSKLPGQT